MMGRAIVCLVSVCCLVTGTLAAEELDGRRVYGGDPYVGYGEPGRRSIDSGSPEKLWRQSEEAATNRAVKVIHMPALRGRSAEPQQRERTQASETRVATTSDRPMPRLRRIPPPSERMAREEAAPRHAGDEARLNKPLDVIGPYLAVAEAKRQQREKEVGNSIIPDPSRQLARLDESLSEPYAPLARDTATDAPPFLPLVESKQLQSEAVEDDLDPQRLALAKLDDAVYQSPPVRTRDRARVTYDNHQTVTRRVVRYYPAPPVATTQFSGSDTYFFSGSVDYVPRHKRHYVYESEPAWVYGSYHAGYKYGRHVHYPDCRPYRYYRGRHYPRYRHHYYPRYRGCGGWGFSIGYRGDHGGFRHYRGGACSSTSIFLRF